MRPSSTSICRLLAVTSLLCALCGCKSAHSEQPEDQALVEQPVAPEEPSAEEIIEEEEPALCEEGAEEYSRRAYKWCMREDVMDGAFIALSDAGSVVMEGAFEQGAMTGTWTGFDPATGSRLWTAPFIDGQEQGVVEGFYEGGTTRYKLNFESGVRQGESVYFDPQGNKIAAIQFDKGKPLGKWTYWHSNGQKAHEYTYKRVPSKKKRKRDKKTGLKEKKTFETKTSIHRHWTKSGKKTESPVGQLGRDDLLPVLEPLERVIVECYMHSRVMEEASGKVVAQIHVGYGGEVSHIGMFADDFQHPFMSACTEREIERLQFPDNPYGPQQLIRTWSLAVE